MFAGVFIMALTIKEVNLTKQEGEVFTQRQEWVLIPGSDYVSPVFKLNPNAVNPGAQLFGYMQADFDGNVKLEAVMDGTADDSLAVIVVLDAAYGGSANGFTESFLTDVKLHCLGIRFSVTGHSAGGGVITVNPHT
ncbi:hypothetical protein PVS_05 [Vibrio phage vB_VspS_VS-ABTNL-3]|nr:hypothetical protein PVS_05 [Vibrio phage vB_VspS_VS-ABTNL-3]